MAHPYITNDKYMQRTRGSHEPLWICSGGNNLLSIPSPTPRVWCPSPVVARVKYLPVHGLIQELFMTSKGLWLISSKTTSKTRQHALHFEYGMLTVYERGDDVWIHEQTSMLYLKRILALLWITKRWTQYAAVYCARYHAEHGFGWIGTSLWSFRSVIQNILPQKSIRY